MKLYRKYKANKIFNGSKFLDAGTVLIMNGDGVVEDLIDETAAGDDINVFEGILSPGFVNTHCHIELSHLKGKIARHTGLVNFVQQVMTIRGTVAATANTLEAMEEAATELYKSGTVAVGDICNTAHSISLKKQSPLYWHNFIEVSGFVAETAAKRLDAMQTVLDDFKEHLSPGTTTFSPHAPYSVSKNLFQLINEATAGQIVSIHNQEAEAEDELYKHKTGDLLKLYQNLNIPSASFTATGKSSFQSWYPYFNRQQRIIAVHNTFTSEADLKLAATASTVFCICINANLYIENMRLPLDMLVKNNCNIVLGTDSYASNLQLNMMEEINAIRHHFPHITLEKILGWATLNGAKALGIANKFGSFEKGKAPGIVHLTADGKSNLL